MASGLNRQKVIWVNNPAVDSIVRINPQQEFGIRFFHTNEKVVDFYYFSELFKLSEEQPQTLYRFKLNPGLDEWAEISSVFLGEIFIVKPSGGLRLSVILNSKNEHILTVVNPKGYIIRMRPSQLLEVVINETPLPNFHTVITGAWGIVYGKVTELNVSPNLYYNKNLSVQTHGSVIPVLRRSEVEEKHFWFKPCISSKAILLSGLYDAGKINFNNGNALGLDLKFSKKDVKKTTKMGYAPYCGTTNLFVSPVTIVPHRKVVAIEELEDTDFTTGCETLEFTSNGRRIVNTKDNEVVVYSPQTGHAIDEIY